MNESDAASSRRATAVALALTAAGPLLMFGGVFVHPALPTLGAVLCLVSIGLDIASGAMRLPFIPLVFAAAGAAIYETWWVGVLLGLGVYCALETISMLVHLIRGK